jgi:hypothetical protein
MIYTVVLNSRNATNWVDAGSKANLTYSLDWSFLPAYHKYKVSFVFNTSPYTASTPVAANRTPLLLVYGNFTAGPLVYETKATGAGYTASNFLGCVQPLTLSVANGDYVNRYYCQRSDNSFTFITDRPSNNNFSIELKQQNGNTIDMRADYIMTVSFEDQDDEIVKKLRGETGLGQQNY